MTFKQSVIQLWLTAEAWQVTARAGEAPPVQTPPGEYMAQWSVEATAGFLEKQDLRGPAQTFRHNGVAGADLRMLSESDMTDGLRMTAFAAKKVCLARERFLAQGAF